MTCNFVDSKTIKVTDIVVDDLVPGTYISLTITNFEIFVSSPMVSESWILKVHTHDDHFIETRDQGLSLTFLCEAPCQTCKEGQPDVCTSCNTLTGKNILYEDICYERCPATTFYNQSEYGCQKCNPNCLTCSYENGNECTSCDPNGLFPYLDGLVCKAECPFGLYEDSTTNRCEPC